MNNKFNYTKSLIFDGYIKTTIKFDNFIIVLRTLSLFEENNVVETYKDLSNDYNLMAITDTVKFAIYSINGCKITNEYRQKVNEWPKQIIIKLFDEYLKLADTARQASKLVTEFIDIDESKLRWSVVKATKLSINSSTILGNDFDLSNLLFVQQLWIYLNLQNDLNEKNKLDWKKVEYTSEMICMFINPKAMQKIKHNDKLNEDEEVLQIEKNKDEKVKIENVEIENSADELFDTLNKKSNESISEHKNRVAKSLMKAFSEDEHDRIVREFEEKEFIKELRIKKENARRSKIVYEKKIINAIVIEPKNNNLNVGFHQSSNLENDFENEILVGEWIVNNIDYSDIVNITSFSMLKNKNEIFYNITNETDEETIKYIESYIEKENELSKASKKIQLLMMKQTKAETRIDARDRILSANKFESQQQQMINEIKNEN